ncbi:MAG: hypothetical protein Q9161_003672 [Pseudevernia consocians]
MVSSSPSLTTNIEILSPATLLQSPHLPAVVKLLNYTYDQSHINGRNGRLLPPDPTTRLQSLTQLSSELEPDGFTFLMFSSETSQHEEIEGLTINSPKGATLIASASAKPYLPTKPEDAGDMTHLLFKRPPPDAREFDMNDESENSDGGEERWPKWEILAVAVHPSLQGRGLASVLLERVIEEIKSRASASMPAPDPKRQQKDDLDDVSESEGKVGNGKVMLMLSTMLELNESYYLKRGFTTTSVRRFEPGTMGSIDGFSAVEMMRWVDL